VLQIYKIKKKKCKTEIEDTAMASFLDHSCLADIKTGFDLREKKKRSLNLTVFNYITTEVGRIHWPLSFLDADMFGQTGRYEETVYMKDAMVKRLMTLAASE
jgi:N-acetylmuramoyl-L-alanine amidase CwlA